MTHSGVDYNKIRETGITAGPSYWNSDRLRGDAPTKGFSWIDRFDEQHTVKVSSSNPQITVIFPVSNCEVRFRATGIDNPGNTLSTTCSPEHKWCEATFQYEPYGPLFWQGEHVWAQCTFYEDNATSAKITDIATWKRVSSSSAKIESTLTDANTAGILKKVPDRFDVLNLLADLSARWNTIGLALRVDSNTLQGLSESPVGNDVKLDNVIRTWISTQPSPVTWETLIFAIEGPLLQHKEKANKIRDHLGLPH